MVCASEGFTETIAMSCTKAWSRAPHLRRAHAVNSFCDVVYGSYHDTEPDSSVMNCLKASEIRSNALHLADSSTMIPFDLTPNSAVSGQLVS